MQDEFVKQYEHSWRVFEKIVEAFDEETWLHTGRKSYTPARIAFHILKAVQYYIEDKTITHFASGIQFEDEWDETGEGQLPTQDDVLSCIRYLREKTAFWLIGMDFEGKNTKFEWAGKTKMGVAIFLLRHSLFHLGELSSLLSEAKSGDVDDYFANA
ncbi:MAG: hypothetical protein P8Z42_07485 [Anaerolineales bacterium]